jgi:hypothetical protein
MMNNTIPALDWRSGQWRARWLSIFMGIAGAVVLLALYLLIVSIAQDWVHAVELFKQDAWIVMPIMIGFGAQVGLYTYLRTVLRRSSRGSKMMMGAGGGTSTVAMVACCAHHVADVLPVLSLSAAASFLAAYKIPFMLISLAMNLLGIAIVIRTIRLGTRYQPSTENP